MAADPRSGGLVPPKISVWDVGLISPYMAEPARLACAEAALFATENEELITALWVERYTSRSPTIVPTYRPLVPKTFSPRMRPTIFPERL